MYFLLMHDNGVVSVPETYVGEYAQAHPEHNVFYADLVVPA